MPTRYPPRSSAPSARQTTSGVHGTASCYSHGCRCRTADRFFKKPQTMGCTEAWAVYRRERVRAYRERVKAMEARLAELEARGA